MINWLLDVLFGKLTPRQKQNADEISKCLKELDESGYEMVVGPRGGVSRKRKVE